MTGPVDLDLVAQLVCVVSRSPIGELEIEREGLRIRLTKESTTPASPALSQVPLAPASSAAPPVRAATARHSVRAPLTGIFYRAAAEGEPPLVSVGDAVEEGQKLGVLEAMKTFNVVDADRAGRVAEIRFENRSSVQSGDVLFVLDEGAAP